MRKPVQVAISTLEPRFTLMVFICDDGSIWQRYSGGPWERHEDIPQDEPGQEPATSPDVVAALRELAKAEGDYRNRYTSADYSGRITFLMFDKMRRAGDAAREVLKRIDEQEEPR